MPAGLIDPAKIDSRFCAITNGACHVGTVSVDVSVRNDVECGKIAAEIDLILRIVVGRELFSIDTGRAMMAHKIQQLSK